MSLLLNRTPLRVDESEGVLVVALTTDDLAESNLQAVGEELFALADRTDRPLLGLDLGEVRFLASTALGKLVSLNSRVKAGGGHLVLANLTAPVFEVFCVSRLDQILDIRPASDAPSLLAAASLAS